jgi:alkylhydroperoxidase family enzyme
MGTDHVTHAPRIDNQRVFPGGVRAMVGLQRAVDGAGLEPLLELVKMRASQFNGCAYCLEMHAKDARASASPSSAFTRSPPGARPPVTTREPAALAWWEDVTRISRHGAPDAVYEELEQTFSPEEIVALTLAIVAINGWNRLAISTRTSVGSYVSPHHQTGV